MADAFDLSTASNDVEVSELHRPNTCAALAVYRDAHAHIAAAVVNQPRFTNGGFCVGLLSPQAPRAAVSRQADPCSDADIFCSHPSESLTSKDQNG